MKRIAFIGAGLLLIAGAFLAAQQAEPTPLPKNDKTKDWTATTHRVWRDVKKGESHFVHFVHRDKMKRGGAPTRFFNLENNADAKRAVPLPIDWAKNFVFPMHNNSRYGDCYYAAIVHADETFTANATTIQIYDEQAIIARYLALSGGDNGLADEDVIPEWTNRGLANIAAAKIVDTLYLKPADHQQIQTAMAYFGPIMFTLSVPDNWISNSNTGDVWDAPARPNPNNGHAVIWNGVDTQGRYKLQTWGTYVWLTQAGVAASDPTVWVAFSPRWFNATGYAPNGKHITELATLWVAAGGKQIPQSVIGAFPPPIAGNVPVITSALNVFGTAGKPFTYQISATNSPTSFAAIGLPPWLSLGPAGLISGTPTVDSIAMFTVTATNAAGTASANVTLQIGGSLPTTLPTITVSGVLPPGSYQISPLGSEFVPPGTRAKLKELIDLLNKSAP